MIRLINGELKTDESSPLDYMVSGRYPYGSMQMTDP